MLPKNVDDERERPRDTTGPTFLPGILPGHLRVPAGDLVVFSATLPDISRP